MENGELTNTLKLKRPVISKNYKDIIDKMYEE
jgi:long-chain acyl-CoA synthetase